MKLLFVHRCRLAFILLVFAGFASVLPSGWAQETSVLHFTSDPSYGATHGQERTYNAANGFDFRTITYNGGATVQIEVSNYRTSSANGTPYEASILRLRSAATDGSYLPTTPLAVGNYPNATNAYGAPVAGRPGLTFAAFSTSNEGGGDFEILDIAFGPSGELLRLAVNLQARDAAVNSSSLYGQLRYNSAVPLNAGSSYFGFQSRSFSVRENDGEATVTVTRNGVASGPASVNYATASGGTATAGADFTPVSGTLTWADGDSAPKIFRIPVVRDLTVEGDETVPLQLSGAQLGGIDSATLTIRDDTSPPPSVLHYEQAQSRFGDLPEEHTLDEPNGYRFTARKIFSDTAILFTVENPAGAQMRPQPVLSRSLRFTTPPGGRLLAGNYLNTSFEFDNITSLAQNPVGSFQVLEASYSASGEVLQFAVNFEVSDGANGRVVLRGQLRYRSAAVLPSAVRFDGNLFQANENAGRATVSVVRTGDASAPTSVHYTTVPYGAKENRDYSPVEGNLFWAAGESGAKSVAVPLIDNGQSDGDRAFFLRLDNNSSFLVPQTATALIRDDETPSANALRPSGRLDPNFYLGVRSTEGVFIHTILPQADGRIYIGGQFDTIGTLFYPGVARLLPNGSPDTSFRPTISTTDYNRQIKALAVQPDGAVLVAGDLLAPGDSAPRPLARLRDNGELDDTFNVQTDGPLAAIIAQPDGRIVVAGYFRKINGIDRIAVARLNPNGSVDESFLPPVPRYDARYLEIALQPDGKLLTVDGFGKLARLNTDGSLDGGFKTAIGSQGVGFSAPLLQPDGKILLNHSTFPAEIFRLNHDGSTDLSFHFPLTLTQSLSSIFALALQPNGQLLVGARFQLPSGADPARPGLLRLNADGSLDNSFQPDPVLPNAIAPLVVQPDGGVLLGGGEDFASADSINQIVFARLFADAEPLPPHPPFFSGEALLSNNVYYLALPGNGSVFGYYAYLADPRFIYHFDLGYLYWFDGNDAAGSIYFYDFTSDSFFYTSRTFSFPYLYDFKLNAFLYYFPDSNNPGRYTSKPRYFFNFNTGQIITK